MKPLAWLIMQSLRNTRETGQKLSIGHALMIVKLPHVLRRGETWRGIDALRHEAGKQLKMLIFSD